MLYILFNPYAEFTQESDYSKPCQIYSRYCEDDDSEVDTLSKDSVFFTFSERPAYWQVYAFRADSSDQGLKGRKLKLSV